MLNRKLYHNFFILIVVFVFCLTILAQSSNQLPEDSNQNDTQDDFDNLPIEVRLNGEHLRAIIVAFESFENDASIADKKRKIENYEIFVQQNQSTFFITFLAKRTKDEINLRGGESSLGKDVTYIINRENYKLIRRYFMK